VAARHGADTWPQCVTGWASPDGRHWKPPPPTPLEGLGPVPVLEFALTPEDPLELELEELELEELELELEELELEELELEVVDDMQRHVSLSVQLPVPGKQYWSHFVSSQ